MYLLLVLVATATPGPAILLAMTNSILHGKRKASISSLGNIVGLLCLGIVAVTSLGAIIKSSEFIFSIIKYAGAAYLIYLGLKMIFQKTSHFSTGKDQQTFKNVSYQKIFFQSLGVALSNPKAIVFLTALFPQFINTNTELLPQFTMLISILMFSSFFFLMFYALLAFKAKKWLTRPNRMKTLNRTSGSIFIGLGVLLASSTNK